MAFGLTEPKHGSARTWMETHSEPDGDGWVINRCQAMFTPRAPRDPDLVFARTSVEAARRGHHRVLGAHATPPGVNVPVYW